MLTADTCVSHDAMFPPSTCGAEPRMQGGTMKRFLLIVPLSLAAGCASISAGPSSLAARSLADVAPGGHWQGYLLHDGLRERILVDLDTAGGTWTGTYSEGDNAVPL